jgi:hypothetical protein
MLGCQTAGNPTNAAKISKGIFPGHCPWELTQIIDEGFYPD